MKEYSHQTLTSLKQFFMDANQKRDFSLLVFCNQLMNFLPNKDVVELC